MSIMPKRSGPNAVIRCRCDLEITASQFCGQWRHTGFEHPPQAWMIRFAGPAEPDRCRP